MGRKVCVLLPGFGALCGQLFAGFKFNSTWELFGLIRGYLLGVIVMHITKQKKKHQKEAILEVIKEEAILEGSVK